MKLLRFCRELSHHAAITTVVRLEVRQMTRLRHKDETKCGSGVGSMFRSNKSKQLLPTRLLQCLTSRAEYWEKNDTCRISIEVL